MIEIDNVDFDENGDIKIDDNALRAIAEEVPVEKKVFWSEDPSMRLTQQGSAYD